MMFLGAHHGLFQCHEFAKQECGFTEASDVLDFPTPGVCVVSALDQDTAYRIIGFLLPPGATDKYRNEPLPRAGSFTSSTALLAHSSLNGDGPVLTGGFPFLSDLRFPDSIITIKQQSQASSTNTTTRRIRTPPHYRTLPLIFKSKSAYGSFTFLPLRCLEE
ncbi:hypothetical protein T08_546 [Trichinella sp. T8]|nr:hypothetical protein T08_546 [Trichinella sp. T8]